MKEVKDKSKSENQFVISLLPLKNVVILPKGIIPIIVGRDQSLKATEYALQENKTIFITTQKHPDIDYPKRQDIFDTGVRAKILQVMKMPNNSLKILVEGICRSRILSSEDNGQFLTVCCQDLETTSLEKSVENEAIWRQIQILYANYAKSNPNIPHDLSLVTQTADDMDHLTDTIAIHLTNLSMNERQQILETADLNERMLKVASLLKKELEIQKTEQKIKSHIQTQVEKNQKEYYLTEQMKAIQKELGRDDQLTEIVHLKEKVKNLKLPKEALEKVEKEINRLEQMPPLSAEAVVSRNYIDWVISIPWIKKSKDNISLEEAEAILEKSHAKLSKAKERIIEFLAAKKYSGNTERATIICLSGPPGVGKTSLAQAIAKSLGREFVRISLGGVRDEAEIRGHRRTYIGALPGKIIQAMRKTNVINPVILLDEIDKISRDMHGDPSSALLEVLDPEQNKGFSDHFLDIEYDLSNVIFITTANHMEGIAYPLLDRMEVIHLSGYTERDKIEIVNRFLIPKKLKEYGLKSQQFNLPEVVLSTIISEYTKEAGVRQIERIIAKLMRKVIQQILKDNKLKKFTITHEVVKEWLGHPKYRKTSLDTQKDNIGLATGLAWTEFGGDVLEIESSIVPGKGGVTLTGQLGEVMQESAQAALSYIRSRALEFGLKNSFNSSKDIHIHIPEGATPKDGPSAGISMCLALISALTKIPVKNAIAMTGEITLRGRVLAVGGLKEKILAAKQYKMETVILPKDNYDDVQEFIKEIDDINLVFVETMDEVIKHALTKNPLEKSENSKKNKSLKKIIPAIKENSASL